MVAIGRGVVAFAAEHHEPLRVCRIIQDLAHLGEPWVRVNHVPVYPHLCVVCGLRIILNHFHLDQLALVVVHRSGASPAREVVAPTARPGSAVGWVRRGSEHVHVPSKVSQAALVGLSQAGVALKVNNAPAFDC